MKGPWTFVSALLLLLPAATAAPVPFTLTPAGSLAEDPAFARAAESLRSSGDPAEVVEVSTDAACALYEAIGLDGLMTEAVFTKGYASVTKHGAKPRILAIADMTQPSTAQRLYVIDLEKKELIMRTLVAHGQGSGELQCTRFSNREGSHATSKGLYKVGVEIVSPKHGAALVLHGLDRGVNCQAQSREVIMHGADYVSHDFIAQHGRLGRSWGCPAVSRADMPRMIELLADGGYLYVHGR